MGINYGSLVSLLLEAIRELNVKIEHEKTLRIEMTARLAALENEGFGYKNKQKL